MSTAACATDLSTRGAFAFHYEPQLSEEGLGWYSQFNLLVTHDPLPADQVARLHSQGTRVLMYEWAVAFYESRATPWQRWLLKKHSEELLNATALTGFAGSDVAPAWYFDPASPEHERERASELVHRIHAAGYDGVFLDTTTVLSVHPEARAVYEARHPDVPYDVAYSRFLVELRKKMPDIVIFTNQGYRNAENYLPYVDYDLTESLITRPQDGSFKLRPWNDPADPWNSAFFLMRTVIEPLSKQYPAVHFSHLNYIDAADRETIRVAFALARIFDSDAYTGAPHVSDEIDPIYFSDFGPPVAPRVDLEDGSVTYREFERGTIAISTATHEVNAGSITIPATAGVPRAFFFNVNR